MGICRLCGASGEGISSVIGVCVKCLRERPAEALPIAMASHRRVDRGVPDRCVRCRLCVNECVICEGGRGFCLVMTVRDGKLVPVTGSFDYAVVDWYLDPHPTNCVATPVCPERESYGMYNLAVFFAGCSLDCIFCQNYEHLRMAEMTYPRKSVDDLVNAAMSRRDITCICYFGGDPTPHAVYAIRASRRILELAREKGVRKRICWETNGTANEKVFLEMLRLSLESGGILKVDFKAWTPSVYKALTGVDAVERVKKNVAAAAKAFDERPEPPPLVVSTLLVPGYVDVYEVEKIAEFLASLNENIPYVLLAFYPTHKLIDLPTTRRKHAEEAYKVAKKAGLKRVFIGNVFLLS